MSNVQLYDYFRSSAAYRVRIALNLKDVEYDRIPINLLENAQSTPAYAEINPQMLVPTLITAGNEILSQSLAICEYLDETIAGHPLLPGDPLQRARVRSMAGTIACDIHPIANLRVQRYLRDQFDADDDGIAQWIKHWIGLGFAALETQLTSHTNFCCGDQPTLADVCLVPQHYNARRFGVDLKHYPLVNSISERCQQLPEFASAHPK